MLKLRQATEADLDFMTRVDLEDEGIGGERVYSASDFERRRQRLTTYLKSESDDAWVIENQGNSVCVGLIIFRFRDLENEPSSEANQFLEFLPRSLFPDDGRLTEIYQLWIDPEFRRCGLATQLKRQAEVESKLRLISIIYTHTEEINTHVIGLNLKLGYKEVSRGLIGDVFRVSLIKQLF